VRERVVRIPMPQNRIDPRSELPKTQHSSVSLPALALPVLDSVDS
jgi:hypothetical protein